MKSPRAGAIVASVQRGGRGKINSSVKRDRWGPDRKGISAQRTKFEY